MLAIGNAADVGAVRIPLLQSRLKQQRLAVPEVWPAQGDIVMKKTVFAAFLLVCSIAPPAMAQRGETDQFRNGRCQLQVNGINRINGRCGYNIQPDGSFRIQEAGRRGDDFYYAYLSKTGTNTATASWSGSRGSTHAHDSLGDLVRRGACWTNRTTRLCLWRQ